MINAGTLSPTQSYQDIKSKVVSNQSQWWTPGYKSNFVTNDLFLALLNKLESNTQQIKNNQVLLQYQIQQLKPGLSVYA